MNKKNKAGKTRIGWIIAIWSLFAIAVISVILVFVLIAKGQIGYIPDIEELQNPKNKYASELYTSDGVVFGRYFAGQNNRVAVSYQEISPYLKQALLATEDIRFHEHSGVDGRSLFRAIVKRGILGQKSAGGGSTITQQLAKLLYSPTAESLYQRALQKPIEWVIAVQLERYYTKEEIMTMYLNQFDFLNNAVGIKSAAQIYFNTTPDQLNLQQSAMLVGMLQNPAYHNPRRFPDRVKDRRNNVLEQMAKYGYITPQECDSVKQLPIVLDFHSSDHKEGIAPYFREYLRQTMTAKKPERKNYASWQEQKFVEDSIAWHNDPLFGWCNKNKKPNGENYDLYTDGLRIFTTIDSRMQKYAEEAVDEHVSGYLQEEFFKECSKKRSAPFSWKVTQDEINSILNRTKRQSERYLKMKRAGATAEEIDKVFTTPTNMRVFNGKQYVDTVLTPMDSIRWDKYFLRCGFMSMNPINGHVKAYVGGPNFSAFQYDMATQGKRQVGSTIKPYLYTLAMEEGMEPCSTVPNTQPTFVLPDGKVWAPRNDSKKHIGEMVTLKWGLSQSNNWISAHLIREFGPQALVKLMHSFGIKSYLDPVVSLCLGPAEVSVAEMVDAYTTFVNKGIRVEPMYVTRIEDNDGNVLATFSPRMNEIISEETSYKMLNMLQAVVNEGTGTRLRRIYKLTGEIGGKTGTTQNNSDGWFMAFTPELSAGVWVGGEDRSIHFDRMSVGQGASMALPIYGLFMQKVYADESLGYSQEETFNIPEDFNPCAQQTIVNNFAAEQELDESFGF